MPRDKTTTCDLTMACGTVVLFRVYHGHASVKVHTRTYLDIVAGWEGGEDILEKLVILTQGRRGHFNGWTGTKVIEKVNVDFSPFSEVLNCSPAYIYISYIRISFRIRTYIVRKSVRNYFEIC